MHQTGSSDIAHAGALSASTCRIGAIARYNPRRLHTTVLSAQSVPALRRLRALVLAAAVPAALAACVAEPVRPPRPAPVVEVVSIAPAPGYHWIKGHYRWNYNYWEWVRGYWAPNY